MSLTESQVRLCANTYSLKIIHFLKVRHPNGFRRSQFLSVPEITDAAYRWGHQQEYFSTTETLVLGTQEWRTSFKTIASVFFYPSCFSNYPQMKGGSKLWNTLLQSIQPL